MKRVLVLLAALLCAAPAMAVVLDGVAYSQPIAIGINMQAYDVSLIREANAGWVRINLPWREINPGSGTWAWGTADAVVRNARSQGLKVLAILSTAPVWAGSNANGTAPPFEIARWETYVRKVARRYAGRIQAYEIWNETNLRNVGTGIGWDRDLGWYPRYADYLRAAALQIRRYAPGTLVVGPVTSSEPDARTAEVFQQLEEVVYTDGPAWSFLDVVSFHANGRNDQSTATVLDHIERQLEILRSRNPSAAAKPIWLTEFGWEVRPGISEESQRDRVRNVVEALTGSGGYLPDCYLCPGAPLHSTYFWAAVFLYKDMDSPGESRGIYRIDRTRKPVITDYLARIPFPARHPNDAFAPFLTLCKARTCTFISSASEPYVSLRYRHHWDFGDGTTGMGRVVTHTYAAGGQYFVVSGVEAGTGPVASDARLVPVK
jgi:hypothetical protein